MLVVPFSLLRIRSSGDVAGGVLYIAAGGDSSGAILPSSTKAFLWGDDASGKRGDNSASVEMSLKYVSKAYSGSLVVTEYAVGNLQAVAIEGTTGYAYSWGSNAFGILGDGTTTSKSSPVSVVGGKSYSYISAGGIFTVAIEGSTGYAYAWGQNGGILGDNTTINRSSPVSVVGGRSYSMIATSRNSGGSHTVAIEGSTGRAYAWGSATAGQIGDNATSSRSSPTSVAGARSYSRVDANSSVVAAIEGSTGRAYVWGAGGSGQIGDNTISSKSSPTSVAGARSFSRIAVGADFVVALEGSTGRAYAWGMNSVTLADGTSQINRSSPTSVIGGRSFTEIYTGKQHVLAYEGSTGSLWGWGANDFGQLGIPNGIAPRSVASIQAASLSMGAEATTNLIMVLDSTTGAIYTWGSNGSGQLGDSTITSKSSPISVVGGRSYSKISAGGVHAVAIEASTGRAYTWGIGGSGTLGDNTTTSKSSPVSVVGGRSFSAIAAGGLSSSGFNIAIEGSTGYAYAWGTNSGSGTLGDNTTTNRSSPVSVVGGRSFSQVSASQRHVVAIEGSTGRAYAWGANATGHLGDNTTTNRSSPTSVVGGRSYSQVSAGLSATINGSHTLAIEGSTGYIYAWGSNVYGQLGDNSVVSKSSPVSVVGARSFSQIAAGYTISAAIEGSTGNAYTWGRGSTSVPYLDWGLGTGSLLSFSSPRSVVGARSFNLIAANAYRVVAYEASSGIIYMWGATTSLTNYSSGTFLSSPVSVNKLSV